jgi:alanyl-tRNA synthetase
MTGAEIRQSFLDFFREKQHAIVPSSSLMPDAPNLLFTNAGMNQFVPIFLGQQKPPWKPPRVADTQKCIRAGGKHNDLEDVGLDTYHHTFFEMLGNWSFGDYFKKEAIEWAWELVVNRWKFPAPRLYATVYKPGAGEPSEFDQEAYDHWAHLFQDADLDPKIHVLGFGKADNFWMMGDTGPCGPCSELHVDLTPDGDTRGSLVNKNDPRCIEIWNLVFIQFNANPDGSFTPLPQRHVDTGMGFERTTAIIQGTKNLTDFSGTVSNYETDIFRPLFDEIEKLSGKKYASTLPEPGAMGETDQEKIDIAFRVVADHIRAMSFAIADGIEPSNTDRNYVVRRILRRAVIKGLVLGFSKPVLFKFVDVLTNTMGDVFPEVRTKKEHIKKVIRREEELFGKTLGRGKELFANAMVNAIKDYSIAAGLGEKMVLHLHPFHLRLENDRLLKTEWTNVHSLDRPLPRVDINVETVSASELREKLGGTPKLRGRDVFKLYDTYGFPLDATQLMARERGLTIDVVEFEKLMEGQRARARDAHRKVDVSAELKFTSNLEAKKIEQQISTTTFLGYDFLEAEVVVEAVLEGSNANERNLVLNQTPFYSEMGGQVGDRGLLHVPGHDRTEVGQLRVTDTQKYGDVVVHFTQLVQGRPPEPGEAVRVSVDVDRRKLIQGHHTVTHLLHWALHEIVSRTATQKGSYVGPDKLTFDFSSAPLTPEQKRDLEKVVNAKIVEDAPVSWTEIPYAEARQRKEIQQFFGEKYGDKVRVLQIGGEPRKLNGYSMELCGGTHVRSTSEIGPFRIVREEAIAAGIRRIEAVAGEAARNWAIQEAARQQERFETLKRKKSDVAALPAFDNKSETEKMLKAIDARAAHLEKLDVDVREWERKGAKASEAELRSRAAEIAKELATMHAAKGKVVAEVKDADAKLLQAVGDVLKSKIKGPIFLVGAANGRVALLAVVPKELSSKFQANKLIQEIAPIIGGKGGGRPENAQGAGTDVGKIDMALAEAERLITATQL